MSPRHAYALCKKYIKKNLTHVKQSPNCSSGASDNATKSSSEVSNTTEAVAANAKSPLDPADPTTKYLGVYTCVGKKTKVCCT